MRDAKTGKVLYLHNDENVHGGVHVWALAGVDFEEAAIECTEEPDPTPAALEPGTAFYRDSLRE